jgi:ribonuclease HI
VENDKARLAGWKAKQLSLAGRITLAKSVIQAIPIYPMMSTPIPKSCLKEIEKVQRAFIWGDTEEKKKAHMISWETLTQPKWSGGVGLRKLQPMNDACLMKMGWSLMTGEHSLWGDVLIGKYGRSGWSQKQISVSSSDSFLWKALARLWPELEFHRCWAVGNGSNVNVWTDKWIDDNTRLSELEINIPEAAKNWLVKDIALPNGDWNFDQIQRIVPNSITQKLHSIVPPHASQGEDTPLWPRSSLGHFTVSAAYNLLTNTGMRSMEQKWNQIWKIESMERIRVFIWQLSHDRLLTNSRLAKWQIGSAECYNCNQFEETAMHVVRDCNVAVHIWRHLLSHQERGQFFTVDFQEWINMNLNHKFGIRFGNDWTAVWATTCYLLWQWRNKSLHNGEFITPEKPWQVILNHVNTYKMCMQAEDSTRNKVNQQQVNIAWIPPPIDWVALNTDGAAKQSEKKAECGGVIRDNKGSWIDGFAKALGDTTGYMAELWGIYEGLKLAHHKGVKKLELRTDSAVLANSLQDRKQGSVMGCVLMRKIRTLMDGPWEIRIIHVYREANRCADMLANMGSEGTSGIVNFANPPSRVVQLVDDDVWGVSFPRLISL